MNDSGQAGSERQRPEAMLRHRAPRTTGRIGSVQGLRIESTPGEEGEAEGRRSWPLPQSPVASSASIACGPGIADQPAPFAPPLKTMRVERWVAPKLRITSFSRVVVDDEDLVALVVRADLNSLPSALPWALQVVHHGAIDVDQHRAAGGDRRVEGGAVEGGALGRPGGSGREQAARRRMQGPRRLRRVIMRSGLLA